jgi:Ca2+-transporting ATPase
MPEYYQQTIAETLNNLKSNVAEGLSNSEITRRQMTYGKNILPAAESTNWLQLVLAQFKDLMVIILIAAAVISALLGDSKDVVVILAIVILNAIIGTYQEFQAEKALAALSAMQVPLVRVRRKGEIDEISAEELVPGDIVLLNEGDRIPADGRLIESINLQIDESALTGESMPVSKNTNVLPTDQAITVGDRENMAFMGTSVTYGRGEVIITQTGLKTELGNIAAMLLQVEQGITPLQRRLNDLSKTLAIGAGVIVVIVFIAGRAAWHSCAKYVPDVHQFGGSRCPRRLTSTYHHQPVARCGTDGAPSCPHSAATRSRNTWFRHRDLLG